MTQTIYFNAGMTCEGCAAAIKRILNKIEGVSDVNTDVSAKKVVVTASNEVSKDEVFAKLMKWSNASGKSVEMASS